MADRPSSTGTGSPCDGLTGLARVRCLREHGKIRGAAARIEAPQRTPRRSAPARPEPAREDRQRDDLGVPVRRTPQQETPALAPPEEERTTRPDPFRPQHVRPEARETPAGPGRMGKRELAERVRQAQDVSGIRPDAVAGVAREVAGRERAAQAEREFVREAEPERAPMPYERRVGADVSVETKRAEVGRLRAIAESERAAPFARAAAAASAEALEAEVYVDEASAGERARNAAREAARAAAQFVPDALRGYVGADEIGLTKAVPGLNVTALLGDAVPAFRQWGMDAAADAEAFLNETVPTDAGLATTPEAVVSRALGSTAPYFLAGAAGGAAGLGAQGARVAAAGAGALSNAGRGYHDALEAGAGPTTATVAYLLHAGVGASEAVPVGQAFARLERASGGRLSMVVRGALAEGAEEATQELFQTLADDTVARALYDPDRRIGADIEEAMQGGASAGAILGAIVAAFGPRDRGGAGAPPADEVQVEEERPPALVTDRDGERLARAEAEGDEAFLRRWEDPPPRRIRLEVPPPGEGRPRQTDGAEASDPADPSRKPTDAPVPPQPDGSPRPERPVAPGAGRAGTDEAPGQDPIGAGDAVASGGDAQTPDAAAAALGDPGVGGDSQAAPELGASPEPEAARVRRMPLREIDADPDRFQPRDAAFSEESVERIVSRFDERELDPLRVWTDPEDGRTYVLAGHSRREAIRRLQDRGDLPLDYEVPIDPYEGTEAEARDFAGRENNSRTAQTPNEDAAALRVATEGMSRSAAQEEARQRYGRNGALVYALSRLSPTGKAVQDLRAFGKSRTKEARDVLTMAQWLGLARDRHEALTDPHERELYDWLRKEWGGRRQPRTQTDWVQFVDDVVGRRSFLGTFDATAPLNLAELPARADLEIDAAIAEADAVLREAQRDRARAEKDFVERGADGDALRRALAPLDDAVRVAQREALRVREEAGRARGEVQKQRGLFGEPGEGRTLGPGTPLDSNTAPGGAPLDDAATGTPEAGPGTRAEGEPDPVGAVGVRASGRPPGGSDGAPGVSAPGGDVAGVVDGGRAAEQGGAGLSDGAPAAPGAGGDRGVQGDASGTGGRSTGGAEPVGSGSPRAEGARPDGRGGASALLDPSAGPLDADERASGIDLDGAPRRDGLNEPPPALQRPGLDERRRQQAEADRDSARNGVHLGDAADVRRSLPVLLAEQQEDVVKAERRFFGAPTAAEREAGAAIQDPRRGVLFTNGTGTGKTYTGLGIVKRHVLAGKRDVLIVVPTDQKAKDWIEDARNLSLQVEQLATTATAGEGVVVTTYANLARNQALLDERDFDLVVYDESHRLLQNAQGDRTAAMDAHLAVTNHPDAVLRKLVHRDPDLRRAKRAADEAREAWIEAGVDEDLKAAWAAAHDEYMRLWYAREKDAALVAEAAELVKRTRTVFLSATPFAYHKTMQYADGYLFESPTDEERRGEYNQAQGFDLFLQQQLGYHMKTGRLQQPEAEVDTSFMERELHAKLAEAGAVSGRTLELDADYSRDFFRVSSGIGEQIDEGLSWLWEQGKPMRELSEAVRKRFSYLYTSQLLEAIKARESVERVRQHLALGRKVVVFHTYNQATPEHPFRFRPTDRKAQRQLLRFKDLRPDLWDLDLSGLRSVPAVFESAFGERAATFNGTVPKRERRRRVSAFNQDGSGLDVLVVQMEAGKEGISLHDTTGATPRVLMTLGLPTKPTDAIQAEGRVYRFGNQSDAVFEYPVTGLAFEQRAFGSKVATRSKTAENLALGPLARDLESAFRDGYANATDAPPSQSQGAGGKELDRFVETATGFDRAKSLYFARGKRSRRNKSREGVDYFATPEPLGYKMVEWLGLQAGDRMLEPSAGHGAIARFVPDGVRGTFVEPSYRLASELRLNTNGDVKEQRFEDLHLVNKFEGIAMNPPFGKGSKTAIEHVAKGLRHLAPGGRLVAIVPDGPSMRKRLDQLEVSDLGQAVVKVAELALPSVTFERAATSVRTRVLVFDRPATQEEAVMAETRPPREIKAETVGDLFDRLRDYSMPMPMRRPRREAASVEVDTGTPGGQRGDETGENGYASRGRYRSVSAETPAEERAAASREPATLAVTVGEETYEQALGGLDVVRSVEMPELVKLARRLMGDVPHLSERMEANGYFKTVGVAEPSGAAQDVATRGGAAKASAQIVMRADLFRQPEQAAQTLAHEIGHLVDFLPDETMARGNLGGRLRALQGYLKHTVERVAGASRGPALDEKDRGRLRRQAVRTVLAREGVKAKAYRTDPAVRERLKEAVREETQRVVTDEIARRRLIEVPVLRKELWAFSSYWRPVPEGASEGFLRYRESSPELFADALSGLLIAPVELKRRAPTFYQAFFEGVAEDRPEVAQAYEEIQILLARGPEGVAQARMQDLYGMFSDADRRKLALEEEQRARRAGEWKTQLVQTLVTRWHPILERAREAEASGRMPASEDPRYLLEEVGMADSPGALFVGDVAERVLQPLKDAGLTERDLAAWMFLNRVENEKQVRIAEEALPEDVLEALAGTGLLARDVQPAELEALPDEIRAIVQAAAEATGGRAAMANPLGFTEETARTTREYLEGVMGDEAARVLRQAHRRFVDLTTPVLDEAARLGVLNEAWWEQAGKPNRYAYATFRVLDFIEDPDRAGVKVQRQRGTFRDVDDVFAATMGKALATIRENARQRALLATKTMMERHFSQEWVRPRAVAPGRYERPRGPLKGVVWIWEDGRKRPYYTDRYVAESFQQMDLTSWRWLTGTMRLLNAPFRASFITYNIAFGLWTNPVRDLRRATKALALKGKSASYRAVVCRYLTEARKAWRYAKGEVTAPGVREMLASGAILPPGESVMFVGRSDGLRKTAERYGMAPPADRNRVLAALQRLGGPVRLVNRFTEALPKFAAWRILSDRGVSERERAWRVRTQVGTPNVTDGGRAKDLTNAVFMFSNVFVQGWRADAQLATRPETRAGYWWRTVQLDLIPKLAMYAAASGLLARWVAEATGVPEDDEEQNAGAWLKAFYDHVGSYDLGSYLVVPLGYVADEGSPSGRKARYLRIPHDESARAAAGALWRLFEDEPDAVGAVSSAFDFGGGQVPGVAPSIEIVGTWSQYLGGQNPRDAFYGRDIISRRAQQARDAGDHSAALTEMLGWTVDEFGVTRFKWKDQSGLNAVPFLNRVVKTTNWGLIEAEREAEMREEGAKASVRLGYDEASRDRLAELYRLRAKGEEGRAEDERDQERYLILSDWHREAYRFYDELAQEARQSGDERAEVEARRGLEVATEAYFGAE